ncbi:DUF397 domain-containing protein [Actinomadura scrupuli]|uniref:DUF397 domain-containing protein n=1 Tax=Actinomadura scrupuli TaxID=559629 RepID=UPI003D9754C4
MTGFPAPVWRKSTHSGDQGGECVEVAALPAAIGIRDSKHPGHPPLTIAVHQFRAFLDQVKAGALDG